jgi:aerobic carbon-monoxide dehydrogenase large subunit
MLKFGVSQPVHRKEDQRFLTGHGRYIDDIAPDAAARLYIFRSSIAHAVITALDVSAAREAPGVLLVMTAADLGDSIDNSLEFMIADNRDGTKGAAPVHPLLATDRVRFVGSRSSPSWPRRLAEAKRRGRADRARDRRTARPCRDRARRRAVPRRGADNVAFDWGIGDEAATDAAFAAPRTGS